MFVRSSTFDIQIGAKHQLLGPRSQQGKLCLTRQRCVTAVP